MLGDQKRTKFDYRAEKQSVVGKLTFLCQWVYFYYANGYIFITPMGIFLNFPLIIYLTLIFNFECSNLKYQRKEMKIWSKMRDKTLPSLTSIVRYCMSPRTGPLMWKTSLVPLPKVNCTDIFLLSCRLLSVPCDPLTFMKTWKWIFISSFLKFENILYKNACEKAANAASFKVHFY